MKEHLIHFFPFLNKEFRPLKENEIRSEEVFKELFPNEPIDISKLRAVYMFQQDGNKTFEVVDVPKAELKFERKTKGNV